MNFFYGYLKRVLDVAPFVSLFIALETSSKKALP